MSFLSELFDFSFTEFVSGSLVKVLYALSVILIGLGYLFGVIASFGVSGSAGIVFLLIVGPLVALLMTIYVRVTLELVMVFFKIYENTREMVRLNAVSGASQPYVPPLGGPAAATGPMPFQGPTT